MRHLENQANGCEFLFAECVVCRFVSASLDPMEKSHHGMDVTRFHRHKSTSGLKLLERKRAHLVKMTVPADSIVKTFNVVKHV